MVRFNLQLFAKSIDDLAKETIRGNYGNGEARKKALGSNYSAVQARVNEMLGSGSKKTTTTAASKATTVTPAPAAKAPKAPSTPEIKGVDGSVVETITSEFKGSDELAALGESKKGYAQDYLDFASNTDIISSDVWAGLSTPYQKSSAVLQAEQLLQSKIDQGYAGTHKEALNNLLNEFMNREDFEYDVDKDQMFQQALASAMGSGKTAMQDTMGQAAALTGGYGSTYATTAGNQAYNAFIEDAYNNLPEYYNMALAAYEAEGQQMLQQYNMLDAADTKEYGQWYDDINMRYQQTRDMVNDEYNAWNANQSMYANVANMQIAKNTAIGNNLYNAHSVASDMYATKYAEETQSWMQSIDSAYKMATLQNNDAWSGENLGLEKEKFNFQKDQAAISQSNWEKEFGATESWRKKEYDLSLAAAGAKVDKNGNISLDDKYANWINPDDIEVDPETGAWLSVNGSPIAGANSADSTPVGHVSGFRTVEGDNFDVEVEGQKYGVENHGKVTNATTKANLNKIKAESGQVVTYNGKMYVKDGSDYYEIGATNTLWWENGGYKNLYGAMNPKSSK